MATLKPLLNRTEIYYGESLSSFIIRLNFLNHYDSLTTIHRICDEASERKEWTEPNPIEFLSQISALSLIPLDKLKNSSPHQYSEILAPVGATHSIEWQGQKYSILPNRSRLQHIWDERNTQFCPYCLEEGAEPYHRKEWSIVAITVCVKHKCLLFHSCPDCHRNVSITDVVRNHCERCEKQLSSAQAIDLSADSVGLEIRTHFRNFFTLHKSQLRYFFNIPNQYKINQLIYHLIFGVARALRSMDYLKGFHQPPYDMPEKFPKHKTQLQPEHQYILITTACKAFTDWPNNFHKLLDNFRRDKSGEVLGQIQQDFDNFYNVWLERKWRSKEFWSVQTEFNNFICENYTLSNSFMNLRRVREDRNLIDRLPCVTEAEAARMLGVSPETIKTMTNWGTLESFQDEKRAGSSDFNLISRESVLERLRFRENILTLDETSEFLGVHSRVAVDFVRGGLIKAASGPDIDELAIWAVISPSCISLHRQLKQSCTSAPFPDMIRAQRAIQMVSAYEQNFVSLIRRILKTKMKAYWGTEKIRDIAVSEEDVAVWLAELQNNQMRFSRWQLARQMGIKRLHTIDTWVENGLITPIPDSDPVQFDRESVNRFVADHVWTAEAAKIIEVNPMVIQKWARGKRLHPVSGRTIDGLHRYLFKRSEVERFRPENRLTLPRIASLLGISKHEVRTLVKEGKLKAASGRGIDRSGHYLFLLDDAFVE